MFKLLLYLQTTFRWEYHLEYLTGSDAEMHMHVIFRESELKSWLVMGTGSMMDWCTVGQLKPKDFVCLDQTWWLHVKAHFEGVIEGKTPITGNNFHKVKKCFSVCIVLSKKRWSCLRIVDDRSCWMILVLPGVYSWDHPSFLVACTWLCWSWGNDPGCCHWHYVCCGNIFVLCSCWAYGVIVTLLLLIPRLSLVKFLLNPARV